jgi:hypothetical protein
MKLKKLFLFLVGSLLFLYCPQGEAAPEHPARAIMQLYAADMKDQKTIEPYIVSILALNEVENGRNLNQVKQFIQWYFSKLNYPDSQGLSGTIYVYTLDGNLERSTGKYDSVDGYAGMFLHLLRQYTEKTGDIQLLREHWNKIEDIANLISVLQDKDGLTWAMPQYKVKYLMDNCESYGGIAAYMELRSLVGLGGSLQYHAKLVRLRKGILEDLYDPGSASFHWAIVEDGTKSPSDWNKFYPDSFAQIFPIYYGLLSDRLSVQKHLWSEFVKHHAAAATGGPIEQRILYELAKKKVKE